MAWEYTITYSPIIEAFNTIRTLREIGAAISGLPQPAIIIVLRPTQLTVPQLDALRAIRGIISVVEREMF